MTIPWNVGLLEPISPEAPCGQNIEDSGDLAQLEAYQIFGQETLEPPPKDAAPAPAKREPRKSDRPPNWGELEELAVQCLGKSKDIRALTHLGAAALRTKGLPAFVTTLGVAAKWLEEYWPGVYPLVDEDAVLRSNAVSAFADRVAIVLGLRSAVLVSGPIGRFSLRDLESVTASRSTDESGGSDDSAVRAAFAAMPIDELRALHAAAQEGAAALLAIDQAVRAQAGVEAGPALDPLIAQFQTLGNLLRLRLADHPQAVAGVDSMPAGEAADGAGGGAVGPVRSRQDAIRALDAVAEFFRKSEPSSPVPLLVDRAKRLVSKSFLEVLADVAPGGLTEAKSAGGIRE